MCGIFAVASKAGVNPDLLWFGTHRARHRGPDDWGFVSVSPLSPRHSQEHFWRAATERYVASDYRVGLGSRRLSILDLSPAGQQPMTLPGSGLWIVFNGEIYNYREIRAELADGRQFLSGTDTEVLLAAYQNWGRRCLEQLNGMFAFVIYDSARMRLFIARDRFGEKPVYYFLDHERFLCASELKQFFEDPDFDKEIDRSALADFFLLSAQDHDERTFFRHIKQLPPAHWMEIDLTTMRLYGPVRYWAPEIAEDSDRSHDAELERSLVPLLADSVQLRLRSDVPVGVCLSGGIDSATICSIAASRGISSSLTAYTMEFPGHDQGQQDEQYLAYRVARHAGVRQRSLTMDAADLWEGLREFVDCQDGPAGGASIFASWKVFQAARNDKTTVLLNGQGCDEFFAGYSKFFFFWWEILVHRRDWLQLSRSLLSYFAGNGLTNWNCLNARKYFPRFLKKMAGGIQDFSSPEFSRYATTDLDIGHGESLNQRLWKDLSQFSLPCLLHWEDRNSMSTGTEMRLPFLDHRIVEAVLKTSVRTKLNAGYTKYLLRQAMAAYLPHEICWQRAKRGFETPAQSWFKTDLASAIKEILSQSQSPLNEFFDVCALREQLCRTRDGMATSLSEFDWFKLVTTDLWLRQLTHAGRSRDAALVAQ
jgi:asparagine synthase (glutamine-hydrolysing)